MPVSTVASIEDLRRYARRRLPPFLFEYIDGGSFTEQTLERNVTDLRALELRQRVLRDVATRDLTTTLLGQACALPVVLGPVGLAGMYARRGEVQAARAAGSMGVPFCLSTVSVCPIAELLTTVKQPFWFQLYVMRDRAFMKELMAQAVDARCPALVFTVDTPVAGTRYRDYRSGLAGAPGFFGSLRRGGQAMAHPVWAWDVGLRGRPHSLGNLAPLLNAKSGLDDFFACVARNFDASVTWKEIAWIRENWSGPLIIKGILDVDDAILAADVGADAIVVSNHGGRQLDGVPSSAASLPNIVTAVGTRTTILADGGVRSGLDVVRLLALGAKGVLLGRAWAYALAAAGEAGVENMLHNMSKEMSVAMALTGCATVADIGPHVLVKSRVTYKRYV